MIKFFNAFLLLFIICAATLYAQSEKKIKEITNCQVSLDSIIQGFNNGDPKIIKIDLSKLKCNEEQIYQSNYYQGLGLYFLDEWELALLRFTWALETQGVHDEELFFLTWKIFVKVGDVEAQKQTIEELHEKFPASNHLIEMLNYVPTVKHKAKNWVISTTQGVSAVRTPGYAQNWSSHSLDASLKQKVGSQNFSEGLGASAKMDIDSVALDSWHSYGIFIYGLLGFSAEVDLGIGYSKSLITLNPNSTSPLNLSNHWSLDAKLEIGKSFSLGSGSQLEAKINYLHPRQDWQEIGFKNSVYKIVGNWFYIAEINGYKDWLNTSDDTLFRTTKGYYGGKIMLNVYYEISNKNSFGSGLDYTWEMENLSSSTANSDLFGQNPNSRNQMNINLSYSYEPLNWLSFSLSGAVGYQNNSEQTDGWIRRANAFVRLSY